MSKFIISQAQFDLAFSAGVSDAQSIAGQTALYAMLAPMSGMVNDELSAQWAELREAFVQGQAHELVNESTAAKRWTRLIDAFDLTKPQTVAAAAKAAQRARKAAKGETASKATVSTGREAVILVAEADKTVSESARLSACIELLKHMNADALIKAQAALLSVVETVESDAAFV